MISSVLESVWAAAIRLLMIFTVCAFFYLVGSPNSVHNIAYKNYEQACKDKGGTVAHVRTSALPSSSYSCVNKDYLIEVK